jgi:hypothetical protein
MADPLRNTAPVSASSGFPERQPTAARRDAPADADGGGEERAVGRDQIDLHAASVVARRLLRERVLSRTRVSLRLGDVPASHKFAEAVDGESAAAFLGRLLSAQNQLAARRAGNWPEPRLRKALDQALREGVDETLELLAQDARDTTRGIAAVAEVLSEYARRLAMLLEESTAAPPAPAPVTETPPPDVVG